MLPTTNKPAVGQVDLVRGLALRAVVEQVVADVVVARARLEQVAAVALVEAAAADLEAGDAADVEQVRQIRPCARRLGEQAVADDELGVVEVGGEDAVLVVHEGAVAHLEPPALEADAGTVAVGGAVAAELDVVDEEVAVGDTQIALPCSILPSAISTGRSPTPRIMSCFWPPRCHVAAVLAGEDLDDVAVPGRLGGVGDAAIRPSRTRRTSAPAGCARSAVSIRPSRAACLRNGPVGRSHFACLIQRARRST